MPPRPKQNDRHDCKDCLPATSFSWRCVASGWLQVRITSQRGILNCNEYRVLHYLRSLVMEMEIKYHNLCLLMWWSNVKDTREQWTSENKRFNVNRRGCVRLRGGWRMELTIRYTNHCVNVMVLLELYQSLQSPREHTLNDISVTSIHPETHTEWCISQLNPPGDTHWILYQSTQFPREHTLNHVSLNSIPTGTHTEWCPHCSRYLYAIVASFFNLKQVKVYSKS